MKASEIDGCVCSQYRNCHCSAVCVRECVFVCSCVCVSLFGFVPQRKSFGYWNEVDGPLK